MFIQTRRAVLQDLPASLTAATTASLRFASLRIQGPRKAKAKAKSTRHRAVVSLLQHAPWIE